MSIGIHDAKLARAPRHSLRPSDDARLAERVRGKVAVRGRDGHFELVRGVVKEGIDVADQQPQHLGMDVRICDRHTQLDMHAGRREAGGRGSAWRPAKEARLVVALSSVRHEAQHDGIEGHRHGD